MSVEPFIKCSDMTRSLAFYSELLDFDVNLPPDPDPAAFMSKYAQLVRDGSIVHLSAHAGDGVYGSVVYIRVGNVDDVYTATVDRGLPIVDDDESPGIYMQLTDQTWGMREFAVRDPDGNKVKYGQLLSE